MSVVYDKYYQTERLFGEPYPELIDFFKEYTKKGKLLDLGCGQGRNAITLARMGYEVTGIDISKVGIAQMNKIGEAENLKLLGKVADLYTFDQLQEYDITLLDSLFHFAKKDKKKELELLQRICSQMKNKSLIVICMQDTGDKVQTLKQAIRLKKKPLKKLVDKNFNYTFIDQVSGHRSTTKYRMVIMEK